MAERGLRGSPGMKVLGTTLFAVALFAGAAAPAREVAGVELPDHAVVEGKALQLQGIGVRTKLVFKVYVAGLYAERPSSDAVELVRSDQMKRIHLRLLRDVSKEKIVEAIREGFEHNSKAQLGSLQTRLAQLAASIPDLKTGQSLELTYVPGKGTVLSGAAAPTVIDGKDFADALFSVWLGRDPVDGSLKRSLLGH